MAKDWIIQGCRKVDKTKDIIILEDPQKKHYLDEILINRFWPIIQIKLKNTNYNYAPKENPETDLELSYELTRSLTFMLFDGRKAFFRGKLSCSINSWMLESEFFMGLSKENNPLVIFEILGNSRFRGNPPDLMIYEDSPEYFQITFHNGQGAGWGRYDDKQIDEIISRTIDINTQLYEFSKDGYISEEKTGDFLSLACEVYEAY
ncbi:MAG: hypothetical protein V2A65_02435 [Candidatus Omnitrophota bacterium]